MSDAKEIAAIEETMPIEPARAAQLLLYIIAGFFVATLVWASVAKLDRVTRGQGRVVTTSQLQEIQYLEGGIVKEILVSSGDQVKAGDVLVKLDPTQMNVEFAQGQEGYNLLAARIARLEAEATLRSLVFVTELEAAAPDITASERALYDARIAELDAALEVEHEKLEQRRRAHEDAKVALATAREAAILASEEKNLMMGLVEKGIEPKMEALRARQRDAEARSEVQRGEIAVSRAGSEVAQAENEIERLRKTFTATATDELTKAQAEMSDLRDALPALQDKVARTDVKAPVDGVVNRVMVSTVGGVVAPGETIVEISPSADSLIVEAKISQADIGFLTVGQEANVKLTAYDSSIYGSLNGTIQNISPDAIKDEETSQWVYNIKVRTEEDTLTSRNGELQILPGMAAEVDILNGKRTVLAYILKPIVEVGDKALKDK